MYKFAIIFSLLFINLSHGGEFTKQDLEGISYFGRRLVDFKNEEYIRIFEEPWTGDSTQVQRFRLESGVDVEVHTNTLKNLKTYQTLSFHEQHSVNSFKPVLGLDFQEYCLPEEFMEKSNDSQSIIKMRKKYGKICDEKFDYSAASSVKLAFLYPNKQAYIKDKHYVIYIDSSSFTQNDFLKKLLLREDTSIYDAAGSPSGTRKVKFRYASPNNQGNKFGVFFRTENIYMNDLGEEELIGLFSVEPVIREF